ncbi:MAG: hypothetical protein ACR2N7_00135 [Acidimicrobiia bacterium]
MAILDKSNRKVIAHFLFASRNRNIIDNKTYTDLTALLHELTAEPAPPVAAPAAPVPATAVASAPSPPKRPPPSSPKQRPPTQRPANRPATPPPPRVEAPAPLKVPVSLKPATPKPERRVAVVRKKIRERAPDRDVLALLSKGWNHLVGDVLANILLYFGVVLATAAIFSFFAFGHFGNAVTNPDMRPLVFAAVPLVFAGMARLLRKQVSVQFSADAIGVIAALTLPIMMSGLFRDGSDQIFPDVSGSPRWILYAVVGLICGAVYWRLGRGRRIYSYLVAPILWASVGAVGLYITFGVSSYQLYAVLAAMALSVALTIRWSTSHLSVATTRIAIVGFPIVLLAAAVFAFNNGDDPAGPSPAIAAGVTGLMLLLISTADSVWADINKRSKEAIRAGMRGAGYVALGISTSLTAAWLTDPIWIGPVLVAYALAVWTIDRRIGGAGSWPSHVARVGVVAGYAISLPFVGPSIAVLSALVLVSALWLIGGPIRAQIRAFAQDTADDVVIDAVATWAPVALGVFAFARVDHPLGGWLMLGSALVAVSSRWLPGRASRLGVWAGYPGLAMTLATCLYLGTFAPGGVDAPMVSWLLIGASVVGAMSNVPWSVRGWLVIAAGIAGIVLGVPEPMRVSVGAAVTAAVGVVAIASTQPRRFFRESVANSVYGHVALLTAGSISVASGDWQLLATVGFVAAAISLSEAVLAERGRLQWLRVSSRLVPAEAPILVAVPTLFASAAFAMLVGAVWAIAENLGATGFAASVAALVLSILASAGLVNGSIARYSVYGFVVVGITLGIGAPFGWIALLIASVALATMFASSGRPMDLYLSIVGVGGTVAKLASEYGDAETVLISLTAYGAILLTGTSVLALVRSDRSVTTAREPFVRLGALILAAGSLAMVALSFVDRSLVDMDMAYVSLRSSGMSLLAATAVFSFAAWVFTWRWAGVVAATTVPVGYLLVAASLTSDVAQTAVVGPLVAILVALAIGLRGSRTLDPTVSPASAMMFSALATSGIAAIVAADGVHFPLLVLLTAAVVVVARFFWTIIELRYIAAALVLVAGAAANEQMYLVAAGAVMVFTVWWEHRATETEGTILRWALSALFVSFFVTAVAVVDPTPAAAGIAAFLLGAFGAIVSVTIDTTAVGRGVRRWWVQLAVLGRVGLVGGVLSVANDVYSDGLYALATWSAIEMAIVTWYAVRRPHAMLRWGSASLVVSTYLLGATAFRIPVDVAAFTAFGVGVVAAVGSVVVSESRRNALTIWWPQLAVIGRLGMGGGAVAAADTSIYAARVALALWSGLETGIATWYAVRRPHEMLRWLSATLFAATFVLTVVAFDIPLVGAAAAAICVGVVAAASAVVVATTDKWPAGYAWWPQLTVLGRVGMVGGAIGLIDTSTEAFLYGIALWLVVEAAVLARYATRLTSESLAWASTTALVLSGVVLGLANSAPTLPSALMWLFVGLSGLVAWTALEWHGNGTIWHRPLGLYAHLAVVASASAVARDIGEATVTRVVIVAVLASFSISWLLAARSRQSNLLATSGAVSAVLAWFVATGTLDALAPNLWRWLPAFVGAAAVWRFVAHRNSEELALWERAAAVATAASFLALVATSASAGGREAWLQTAIVFVLGAIATYDVPTLSSTRIDGSSIARLLVVGASWLLIGWYRVDDANSLLVLAGITVVGAVIAVLSASRTPDEPHPDMWVWLGFQSGAVVAALAVFGWPSVAAVMVLLVTAASVTSHGVLIGSRRWAMAGIEGVVAVGAALLITGGNTSVMFGVLIAAVAILIATETERLVSKAKDEPTPEWIRVVEWFGLSLVPATAVVLGIQDIGYVPVLFTYGVVLLAWGIVSQVRRRVFAGALSALIAVGLAVFTPIADIAALGMRSAGLVGVTFVGGALAIVIAILIERYHQRLGVQLGRLTDAMADWD